MVRGDAGVEHQMIDGTLGYSCPRCGARTATEPDAFRTRRPEP